VTGVPASWAGPTHTLIMRESGGNPNAINLTRLERPAGHPSQGLMQTIPVDVRRITPYRAGWDHEPGREHRRRDPVDSSADRFDLQR